MSSQTARYVIVGVLVTLLFATSSSVVAGYSEDYNVNTEDSIELPDRTVGFGENKFKITAVGHVEPTETISATTTAPADKDYVLHLRNTEAQIESFSELSGDNSTLFSTQRLPPGTYALVVRADRDNKALHPIVVSGYDSEVGVDGELLPNKDFTVDVELEERADAPRVNSVVVARIDDGEIVEEVKATKREGIYKAEFTGPKERDDLRVVTTVLGEDTIAGTSEQEILEVNDRTITPSKFTVNSEGSSTVSDGERIDITAEIKNKGDYTATKEIQLQHADETVASKTLTLNGSESSMVTFEYDVKDNDQNTLSFVIQTDDDAKELAVDINENTNAGSDTDGQSVEQNNEPNQNVSENINGSNPTQPENGTNTSNNVTGSANSSELATDDANDSTNLEENIDSDNTPNSDNSTIEPVSQNDSTKTASQTPGFGIVSAIIALTGLIFLVHGRKHI